MFYVRTVGEEKLKAYRIDFEIDETDIGIKVYRMNKNVESFWRAEIEDISYYGPNDCVSAMVKMYNEHE